MNVKFTLYLLLLLLARFECNLPLGLSNRDNYLHSQSS